MKKHYRHENDCLNCGTVLEGKFCHNCGQENLQIKENFGHLMNHAVSDYFHFDHQFFHTLRPLLLQPGKLTNEYMAGKRVQYLHPIKMYIFISLIFFILFFKHNNEDETDRKKTARSEIAKVKRDMDKDKSMTPLQKQILKTVVDKASTVTIDSTTDHGKKGDLELSVNKEATAGAKNVKISQSADTGAKTHVKVKGADESDDDDKDVEEVKDGSFMSNWVNITEEPTYDAYLEGQKKLPADRKDNLLERLFKRKIYAYKRYGDRAKEVFLEEFKHNVPKMMFVLLPLFAVILRFAFWRSKKFYVEHLIFSFHLHCFLFLFLTIIMLLMMVTFIDPIRGWISFAATIGIVIYIYKALKAVYHLRRWRTVSKMIGMSFVYTLVFSFCMVLLALITAVTAA